MTLKKTKEEYEAAKLTAPPTDPKAKDPKPDPSLQAAKEAYEHAEWEVAFYIKKEKEKSIPIRVGVRVRLGLG